MVTVAILCATGVASVWILVNARMKLEQMKQYEINQREQMRVNARMSTAMATGSTGMVSPNIMQDP